MKRRTGRSAWVRRSAWALVLGVVTTVALAWPVTVVAMRLGWVAHNQVANRSQAYSRGGAERFSALTSWRLLTDEVRVIRPHPRDSRLPLGEPKVLAGWVRLPEEAPEDLRASVNFLTTTATGIPWRCAAGEEYGLWHRMSDGALATEEDIRRPPRGGTTTQFEVRNKWRLGGWSPSCASVGVPLRILWGGLAADVLVWSAAWVVVLWVVALVRSARRRGLGLCAGCGYDLKGVSAGAVCPECGTARVGGAEA
ncbi:MAG: hypothetical protein QM783_18355 [Phycisphaerales bacterium]